MPRASRGRKPADADPEPAQPLPDHPALCVLASGSQGNCSLLTLPLPASPTGRLNILIDLGLSPRRTRGLLRERGLSLDEIDSVLMTHLDADHAHLGWSAEDALPRHTELFVFKSHRGRGERMSLNRGRMLIFREQPFQLRSGLVVEPRMTFHDSLGAAAFRIPLPTGTLGYLTDCGRVTDELVDHLRAVDTLAIESNYCPALQLASDRPLALKRRIMGGRGHLSNHESREAVAAIGPTRHVVLLHLSRHCNRPDLVLPLHEQQPYTLTISTQHEPTPWIPIRAHAAGEQPAGNRRPARAGQGFLFSA
jgi:phosphoribosyl 1,2-cyclic phosphodiesterase